MATILESEAAFNARAIEHGITRVQLARCVHSVQWSAGIEPYWINCNHRRLQASEGQAWSRSSEQIEPAGFAWLKKVQTLKRKAGGSLPLDTALEDLQTDPAVMFHLMPLPLDRANVQGRPQPEPRHEDATKLNPRPKNKFEKPSKRNNKGKGKGKSKPSSKGKMPVELIGLHQQTKSGKRMCYNFNPSRGCDLATPGQECVKGQHSCMRCFGAHSAHQCNAPIA
eukprot:s3147_g19.t1